MGKSKEFPRCNVFSVRVSDEVLRALEIKALKSGQSRSIIAYGLLVQALEVEG